MPVTSTGWQVVAASVAGTSHAERSVPCQDAHATHRTDAGMLVVAVADGAGSAPHAQEGSRTAVDAAVACATEQARDRTDGPLGHLARRALEAAREAVLAAAADEDPGHWATTLSVVVADGATVAVAQVGDGSVVVRTGEHLRVVAPADRSEFLNETCFLTSAGWEEDLRVEELGAEDGAAPGMVAVMTDGLQLLALDMATGGPHPGFFDPLFDWAGRHPSGDDELADFLASERVCARTDDDKTLVLATLRPEPAEGP